MNKHKMHTIIPKELWTRLQIWCRGSPTNTSPSEVVRALLTSFDAAVVKPDLKVDPRATADYEKIARGIKEAIQQTPDLVKK